MRGSHKTSVVSNHKHLLSHKYVRLKARFGGSCPGLSSCLGFSRLLADPAWPRLRKLEQINWCVSSSIRGAVRAVSEEEQGGPVHGHLSSRFLCLMFANVPTGQAFTRLRPEQEGTTKFYSKGHKYQLG